MIFPKYFLNESWNISPFFSYGPDIVVITLIRSDCQSWTRSSKASKGKTSIILSDLEAAVVYIIAHIFIVDTKYLPSLAKWEMRSWYWSSSMDLISLSFHNPLLMITNKSIVSNGINCYPPSLVVPLMICINEYVRSFSLTQIHIQWDLTIWRRSDSVSWWIVWNKRESRAFLPLLNLLLH